MSRQVFIGGTGRSGTTILSKILAKHSDIYTFPHELRFLTDPDGILNLEQALVNDWSYYQADFAIDRFRKLLVSLSTRYRYRYPNADFKSIVGSEFYFQWVEDFCASFYDFSFKSAWGARVTTYQKVMLKLLGKNSLTDLLLEQSYYCPPLDKDVFTKKVHSHLSTFFARVSEKHSSNIVIDHTPTNLNHINKIFNVLPEVKFIHIYRDPRDVAVSMSYKDWGMGDLRDNLKWYEAKMSRWHLIRHAIPKKQYIELQFEELMNNFESSIEKVCDFLEINVEEGMFMLDVSKHNIGHWKEVISSEDEKSISVEFHELIEKYGH